MIGGGGCLALVVLLLVGFAGCAALIGSGGSQTEEPTGPGLSKANAVAIGETVKVGDVTWTVTNAQRATELSDPFETRQGNFVIVDFTFGNESSEQKQLDTGSLNMLDAEDRVFETDSETDSFVPPELNIFLDQVNPGVTQNGRVIFSVPADAEGLVLRANDTGTFSENYSYIDLNL